MFSNPVINYTADDRVLVVSKVAAEYRARISHRISSETQLIESVNTGGTSTVTSRNLYNIY
jgi:hypothetical protein